MNTARWIIPFLLISPLFAGAEELKSPQPESTETAEVEEVKREPVEYSVEVNGARTFHQTKRLKDAVYRGLASVTTLHETEIARDQVKMKLVTSSTNEEVEALLNGVKGPDGKTLLQGVEVEDKTIRVQVKN